MAKSSNLFKTPFFKLPVFGAMSPRRSKDVLCFDSIADAIKIASVKVVAAKKLATDVYYKDCRGIPQEEAVKAVREYLDRRRLKDFSAVVTVPSHLVITKNIEIPSQDPKEIKDIINLQAGRLTPYSREEVIIDYVHIGSFRQSYTKLLLVIVSKDVVQKQLALLNGVGVKVARVALSLEAIGALLYQYLKLELRDSPFCVIHADAMATDFGIFLKDRQIFLRSISVGAHHLINERDKFLSRFIDECKKSFDAYQAEDIEQGPIMTVLTGAIDGLRDLEVMMLDAFRMPIRMLSVADLIPRTDYVAKESVDPKGISMLGVLSAAFRADSGGINLIPEEIKLRLAIEERGRDIIKTGILAMTALLFLFASFLCNIYFKADYLKKLNDRYKILNAEASQIEKDFSKVRIVRNYLSGRGRSLNVLVELYDLTPLEISLTSIRLKESGSFTVRGEASSMSGVFAYITDLEKSSYFKGVKTKYTSKKKVDNVDIVDFELAATLEGVGEESL